MNGPHARERERAHERAVRGKLVHLRKKRERERESRGGVLPPLPLRKKRERERAGDFQKGEKSTELPKSNKLPTGLQLLLDPQSEVRR